MTRLQSESSSIFASDLKKYAGGHGEASLECRYFIFFKVVQIDQSSNMRSSAAV